MAHDWLSSGLVPGFLFTCPLEQGLQTFNLLVETKIVLFATLFKTRELIL